MNRLIEQARKKSSTFIDNIIECEVNYIYTNNEEFYDHLERPTKDSEKEDPIVAKHPVVAILRKRVLAYHRVVIKNLRELIPKNIKRIVVEDGTKSIEF